MNVGGGGCGGDGCDGTNDDDGNDDDDTGTNDTGCCCCIIDLSNRFPNPTNRVCNNNKYVDAILVRPNCCASYAAWYKSFDSANIASYTFNDCGWNNTCVVVVILLLSL